MFNAPKKRRRKSASMRVYHMNGPARPRKRNGPALYPMTAYNDPAPARRRRRNPDDAGRLFSADTLVLGLQVGAGIVLDRTAPQLVSTMAGKDWSGGVLGFAIGLAGTTLVSSVLYGFKLRRASVRIFAGGIGSAGAKLLGLGIDYLTRPVAGPAPRARGGMSGGNLGLVTSPESMIQGEAVLGDVLQVPENQLLGDMLQATPEGAAAAAAASAAPSSPFAFGSAESF